MREPPVSLAEGSDAARLRLACEPQAARQARSWLRGALEGWPDGAVEVAQLLLSELATNAVLHARTGFDVVAAVQPERARIGVEDLNRARPLPKRYREDAVTGRGMHLVATLADAWGMERRPGGKLVWFEITRSSAISASSTEAPPIVDSVGPVPAGTSADTVEVHIEGLPLAVYLEAEQHNDALMREFSLIAETESGHELPRRLIDLAGELRQAFVTATTSLREQVELAVEEGRTTVDLRLEVPRHGWAGLLRLAEQLEEADRYCEEGELLTLVSSPRLRRFRRWYAQAVADQVAGRPSSLRWPAEWG